LALFQLAMFAKTAVSFLPVTLLVVAWWQRERLCWRDVAPLLPMLGSVVVMSQVTFHVEQLHGATGQQFHIPLLERVLISGRSFWFYLEKLFLPYRLTFIYERWAVNAASWWQYVYPAATVGLLAGLWGMRKRIGRGAFAATLHFYISTSMLILIVVLYFTCFSFVSDHWQYFGCMSVIALAAAGITRTLGFFRKSKPILEPAFCGILLLVLGVLTWRQSGLYADSETLWRANLARNPNSYLAHNGIGIGLFQRGDVDGAIVRYQKALDIQPGYAEAHNDLGIALAQKGQLDKAIAEFEEALKIHPNEAAVENNLGTALLQKGQVDQAMALFQKVLEIQPDYADAHHNLGTALLQKGRVDDAIVKFQKTLEIRPDDAPAHNDLGRALLQKGRVDEAIAQFQKALEIRPDFPLAQNNLGHTAWVLATSPQASVRNGARAVELAQQAERLSEGRNPVILGTLAAAYAEVGRFTDAVATAQQALQLANAQSNAALANALQQHIGLYQAGLPFHGTSSTNAPPSSGKP
jgi:protein O-mannosyl-transferase